MYNTHSNHTKKDGSRLQHEPDEDTQTKARAAAPAAASPTSDTPSPAAPFIAVTVAVAEAVVLLAVLVSPGSADVVVGSWATEPPKTCGGDTAVETFRARLR